MITITDTDLEKSLISLLQRNLQFIINKNIWREGRLLLFKQNGFYIELVIENKKHETERFEIPIPFDIIQKTDFYLFSYEIEKLVCNKPDIVKDLLQIEPSCRSKYFNNCLKVAII